MKGKISLDIP